MRYARLIYLKSKLDSMSLIGTTLYDYLDKSNEEDRKMEVYIINLLCEIRDLRVDLHR